MNYFSEIKIHENVLSNSEMTYVNECLASDTWGFGQKSQPGSDKKFWYMELSENKFFTKHFFERIKILTKANFTLSRVYANGQTFGLDSEWHTDSLENNAYTFLYYSNNSWDPSWGGETLFSVDNNILHVIPKPNAAIFFPSNVLHYGRSPNRDFRGLRTTIAFKLKLVN